MTIVANVNRAVFPELDGVVLADVVSDDVVAVGQRRVGIGVDKDAGAVVVVAVVVLEDALDRAAVEVEAVAVGCVAGAVPERFAVLDGDAGATRPSRSRTGPPGVWLQRAPFSHAAHRSTTPAVGVLDQDSAAGVLFAGSRGHPCYRGTGSRRRRAHVLE